VSTTQRVGVTGLLPPIPTPFRDGRVDFESLRRLVDDLRGPVDGILVRGSVGETPSLTVSERIEVMETVAEQLDDDAFLAVSVADNAGVRGRQRYRQLARAGGAATDIGAHLLMLSCPTTTRTVLGC